MKSKLPISTLGNSFELDRSAERKVLFLQGPISLYFRHLSYALEEIGFSVLRINFCFGDWIFWRRSHGLNYRGTAKDWRNYIRHILTQEGVTDLLLVGERRSYHAVAIEEANKLGISTVSIDFGYLRPDFITFEYDGLNGDSQFPREREAIERLAASAPAIDRSKQFEDNFWVMATYDMAYSLSNLLFYPLYRHYRSHKPTNAMRIYLGTGWQMIFAKRAAKRADELVNELRLHKQKYFVAALQMEGDFSILAYSPFASVQESLMVMLESFCAHAPDDAHLIVKLHPLDPSITPFEKIVREFEQNANIQGRLHVTRGGSISNLFETCLGLVTVNSTLGLRALCAGVPVKTLGQAVYAVDGITSSQTLDRFWREPGGPDEVFCEQFVNTLASTTQIRGTFYAGAGLAQAVEESVYRLANNMVNVPVKIGELDTRPATKGPI